MPKPSTRVRLRLRPGAGKASKVRLEIRSPAIGRPPREGSKLARILALLMRPAGASIGELIHVTGWREHSVRAALTGIVRGRLGLKITSVKSYDRLRRYYVTAPGTPDKQALPKEAA